MSLFYIDGHAYGGWRDFTDDHRITDFVERFLPGRVLELGCLEGAQTAELSRRGYAVTALEGRAENVARARWILRRLGIEADVLEADLESVPLSGFGHFDVVFCSGVLYHLPEPWRLIEQMPRVAPALYLSTHFADREETVVDGRPGRWFQEGGREEPLSGLSERSFWFTKDALLAELRAHFGRVELIREFQHDNGPLMSVAAWR